MLLTDSAVIRALLETDRAWAAYALGDLAPGFSQHAEWRGRPGPEPALLLLYHAFETPVLFTLGPATALDALLDEIVQEPALYLSIRPEILPLVEARWRVQPPGGLPMWRMVLPPGGFRPAPGAAARPLGSADLPALQALYADGAEAGEAPDFFSAEMLAGGCFYGVWEDGALVAAAGTHLVAPALGVAAIGNIYTRRDRRRRGLAAHATSAVIAALLAHRPPLATLALNVSRHNLAALRVYERLGFERFCEFYEGLAVREG